MQPVDRAGALAGELVTTVDQQPHDLGNVLALRLAQVAAVDRGHRSGTRVDVVGLASRATIQQPHPSRQRRGHVHDHLASGQQLLGQQPTGARRALHGPTALP